MQIILPSTEEIVVNIIVLRLAEIVVGGLIGFIAALIVKYKFPPKIEVIFKTTRNEIISSMFDSVMRVHNSMDDVIDVLQRQNNFDPDRGGTIFINENDTRLFVIPHTTICNTFDSYENSNFQTHITHEEHLAFLNYFNFSKLFMDCLMQQPREYSPENLSARQSFALDLITLFPDQVPDVFKNAWNNLP